MKLVCYGESPADQAAMAVFAEGILGTPPEPTGMSLEGHGVTGVIRTLVNVYRGVYYGSDADGLVVVVDCDDTELHDRSHDPAAGGSPGCRFCEIYSILSRAQKQTKPMPGRSPLRFAVGLAVPAIEAWYLVGREHQVGEAAWKTGVQAGRPPFTRPELKKRVYGNDRPSLEHETECAVREARRIIADIRAIERAFPVGFGLMAEQMRAWIA